VPTAKLTNLSSYSIVSDYLGTPVEAYNDAGECVWSAELDIYGRVKDFTGDLDFIPFRYQGQYSDTETGLYYNRFRYYEPAIGQYTQPDPIGLEGNNPTLYAYVNDPNCWIDPLGLNALPETARQFEERINNSGMGTNERIAAIKGKLNKVAKRNGWERDNRLSKKNERDVFRTKCGELRAADTEKGRFEYTDSRGKHLGEFDIDGIQTALPDLTGRHNLDI
jgi:RHS repeat-associated protein